MTFFANRLAPLFTRHPHLNALVLGHLAAYGMGPFYAWPVMAICLSAFWVNLTRLATEKSWQSWANGFLFGFGFFVSSLWWIGNALLVGGNDFKWAYPLAVCGLPILFALYPMLACGLTRLIRKGRSLAAYSLFVALMFAAEWARGTLLTGFPWNLTAMAWTNNLAVLQFLSVGGMYGLTALSLFLFTAAGFVMKGAEPKPLRIATGVIALLIGIGLYMSGAERLATHPTTYNPDVVVQIIQPNIKQEDKWDPDKKWDNTRATLQLIEPVNVWKTAKTRVVVMPETALTYHDFQTQEVVGSLKGRLSSYEEKTTYLLSGALLRDDVGYHNSLVVLDKNVTPLDSFDKFHLVPFGEYIPFQRYIPIGPITNFAGFVEGPGPRTLSQPDLPPFSPLVCYEVIFPGHVVSASNPRPDWMVNVTNDAWYGISAGPFQHLAHARYRAIEEGLPMVRAANTGISAVIDSYGRVIVATGLFQGSNIETLLPLPAK